MDTGELHVEVVNGSDLSQLRVAGFTIGTLGIRNLALETVNFLQLKKKLYFLHHFTIILI